MREFERLAVECKVQEDDLRMAQHVAGFNDDLQNIIKVHAGLDYKDIEMALSSYGSGTVNTIDTSVVPKR